MRTLPDYVLHRDVLDAEIEGLAKMGVKIKTKLKVESIDKLLEKGFDAVLLAAEVTPEIIEAGAGKARKGAFNAGAGETSFIEAVAAGRRVAMSIDRYLGGDGNVSEILAPIPEGVPRVGRIDNFAQRRRQEMPKKKPAKQIDKFDEIELGFSNDLGEEEAKRCMGCDLRFAVARMVAGPVGKANKTLVRS